MTTTTSRPGPSPPLHSRRPLRRRHFNRLFAAIYVVALLALLRHHTHTILTSTTVFSLLASLSLLVADLILAYIWSAAQAFRMNPVVREEFVENLEKVLDRRDFPALDVFICTADPYKEPPLTVLNTALSLLAYDYPTDGKLSVYVSDDGGSELTMFALMEAAKFGKRWLAFCRENNVSDRCPSAYFGSGYDLTSEAEEIKMMYEKMKLKVESVVEKGKVMEEYITSEDERRTMGQFRAQGFTRANHPTVIKVLLDSKRDMDIGGEPMPNLIYISRHKSSKVSHHFKAGALNTLLRVSATMTNAPLLLTMDCDMYSNDPWTAQRALCYLPNKSQRPNCGYVQFPQRFCGFNQADIYASEYKRLFVCNPIGMDGLNGPSYVGTGCFFRRRIFFGGPSTFTLPETPELGPDHIVNKLINSEEVLNLAHHVAECNYENQTKWGSKIGFRYGSLVEDYYTGYRLQCEGWQSIFCNPKRPAFLGDVPICLVDVLNQNKRWCVGLLEVVFSTYSPLTFGIKAMGFLMAQCYAHYALWPLWVIPITIYAFIPSLALLRGIPIFPKIGDPMFLLYVFLFVGAYGQDCVEFVFTQGTLLKWWSDQRFWLLRGLSCCLFGFIEYAANLLGVATSGFHVTSKVMDDELCKRYDKGIIEFGIWSPLFVPIATATLLNLVAFVGGSTRAFADRRIGEFFVEVFITGFGVVNGLPIYEAMFWRSDRGRMSGRVTITSALLVGALCGIAFLVA